MIQFSDKGQALRVENVFAKCERMIDWDFHVDIIFKKEF